MYKGEKYQKEILQILGCERCNLSETRKNIVVYRGNPRTDVMVIGEA